MHPIPSQWTIRFTIPLLWVRHLPALKLEIRLIPAYLDGVSTLQKTGLYRPHIYL
jgi:hypothetical protein